MKNKDDLFENGLESTGMPYQDKYWQDMEAILDRRMPVKSGGYKKIILALVFFGMVMGSVIYYWTDTASEPAQLHTGTKPDIDLTAQPKGPEFSANNLNPVLQKTTIKSSKSTEHAIQAMAMPHENTPLGKQPSETPITLLPSMTEEEQTENDFLRNRRELESISLVSKYVSAFKFSSAPSPFLALSPLKRRYPKYLIYTGIHTEYRKQSLPGRNNLYESFLPGFNVGIDLSVRRKNSTFNTGLEKSDYSMVTHYPVTQRNVTYDTAFRLINKQFTQTPRGSRVALVANVVDSTEETSTATECLNCKVKFNYVNIPLKFGYEWHRKRMGIFASGGIQFSLLTGASGALALTEEMIELEGASILKKENLRTADVLNRHLTMIAFGTGIKYNLSSVWELRSEFTYRKSMNAVFRSRDYPWQSSGITVGLMYRVKGF